MPSRLQHFVIQVRFAPAGALESPWGVGSWGSVPSPWRKVRGLVVRGLVCTLVRKAAVRGLGARRKEVRRRWQLARATARVCPEWNGASSG